ncbi:MAG: hypothetical protein JO308_06760 [Verrucomicrobia bacterium]|nr:hypothetical protein [Verrucomicrobiota bacterium]
MAGLFDLRKCGHVFALGTFLFFMDAALSEARSDEVTTVSGKTYHEVQVLSRSSNSMLIQSKEGEVHLMYEELKPGDREKYAKTLAKSMDLPAMTVLGEKPVFTPEERLQRDTEIAAKELRKTNQEKEDKAKDKKDHPPVQQLQVFSGVNLQLGANPQTESFLQPGYLDPKYQQLSPEIVEKQFKPFTLLNNQ